MYTPMSLSYLSFLLTVDILFLVCIVFLIANFMDRTVVWFLLHRFEVIIVIGYVLLQSVVSIWRDTELPSASVTVSVSASVVGHIGACLSFIQAVMFDGIPYQLLERYWKIIWLLVASLFQVWVWVAHGLLSNSDANSISNTAVCILMCLSLERMYAACAMSISIFIVRQLVSVVLWPTDSVLVVAKVRFS